MPPTAEPACLSCGSVFKSDMRWKVPLIVSLFLLSFALSVVLTLIEVALLLDNLKKRNMQVIDRCLEDCQDFGGTVEGQIIDKPKPVYPPDARARRISGEVVVRVVVDEQVRVAGAQAVSGDPLLREASVARRQEGALPAHQVVRPAGEGDRGNPIKLCAAMTSPPGDSRG